MNHRSPRSRAFTLVELLVVIGIIALLISILLPALNKARQQANTVKCLAQHKQLMMAFMFYSNEWNGAIPWVNGGGRNPANQPYGGWLYDSRYLSDPNNFSTKDLEANVFWDTLGSAKVYRCPSDPGPWISSNVQSITTYVMNWSLSGLVVWSSASPTSNLYRITDFKGDTAVFWEIGNASTLTANSTKDGNNGPDEGITVRHQKGTTISFIDGHAETWSLDRYLTELNLTGGRDGSALWRAPGKSDGGHTAGTPKYIAKPAGSAITSGVLLYSE